METSFYSAALLDANGGFAFDRFRHELERSIKSWRYPGNIKWPSSVAQPNKAEHRSIVTESIKQTTKSVAENEPTKPYLPRLKLVLDLDNTLLQTVGKSRLRGCDIRMEDFVDSQGRPEMYKFSLPQLKQEQYYVKFRPDLREFLSELHQYCDFAIHTNAVREYADVILSILDPCRRYFGQRVAARHFYGNKDAKKDLEKLFEACSSAHSDGSDLLILDDRKDVWEESVLSNLIQCTFYDFFDKRKDALIQKYGSDGTNTPCTTPNDTIPESPLEAPVSAEFQNSSELPGADASLLDVGRLADDFDLCALSENTTNGKDESEEFPSIRDDLTIGSDVTRSASPDTTVVNPLEETDRQLYFLKKLIIEVAEEYRKKNSNGRSEVSASDILASRRRSVLGNVNALLAGFNKTESPSEHRMLDSGPQHRRRLQSLGATVSDKISESLTHVVMMRHTTTVDLIRNRYADKMTYVHALWLAGCEASWIQLPGCLFDPLTLLKKYEEKPPLKPYLDAWDYMYRFVIKDKEQQKMIDNNTTAVDKECHDGYTILCDEMSSNFGSKLVEREWLATGIWSDGAEVWSPTSHTVVRFDPIKSSEIVHELRLEGERQSRAAALNVSAANGISDNSIASRSVATLKRHSELPVDEPTSMHVKRQKLSS